jgi:hypothetical protein|tara:strand:- start:399 stop:719 length:321 start_codon:yes stop_codon:yes gene_type:complete
VTYAKQRSALDFAEVVNGRASMYGVVFGGANWALTGLNITQQMQQIPFDALAVMSCVFVVMSMKNADEKLNEKQFEDWATRETGRTFMIIFALMSLFGLGSGPYYQ